LTGKGDVRGREGRKEGRTEEGRDVVLLGRPTPLVEVERRWIYRLIEKRIGVKGFEGL